MLTVFIQMGGGSIAELLTDSGTLTCTLTSDFKPYNNNSNNNIRYRKIGKTVYIAGTVSPKTNYTSTNTAKTICTLPEGFRPMFDYSKLCQGSGKNFWLLNVLTNGSVTIARYGVTENTTVPDSAWLLISATFITN